MQKKKTDKHKENRLTLKQTLNILQVLQGHSFDPDWVLLTRLHSLYDTFVTFHGTVDSLKLVSSCPSFNMYTFDHPACYIGWFPLLNFV